MSEPVIDAPSVFRAAWTALLIVAVAGCTVEDGDGGTKRPPRQGRLEVSGLLSGDAEGFARAEEPRIFDFPADHGSHPDFRTEWWYLTGNLDARDGRRFGYQFTIFRNAVSAARPERSSGWAARQVYMAHLALTDVASGEFHAFERFARGAAGLSGAGIEPFRVWLGDWELSGGDAPPPFSLRADAGDVELDLDLAAAKPLVLQGDAGLSSKGRQPGNASYYYAFTRLATSGRIRIGAETVEVDGSSWLDREWSTSVLEEGQSGWDWFALQLDDGTELMVYQLRREDGVADRTSSGSFVATTGNKTSLGVEDFEIEVLDWWQSRESGARYPSNWRVSVPGQSLDLHIEPVLREQELRLSVVYWEGAVDVVGTRRGVPVTGKGYVELTGYGGE
jgi:predicted secreted hydrolase